MSYLDRMKRLAEEHLAEYDLDVANEALREIDNATPAEIPDRLLVEAARRYLKAMADPAGGDPSAILRQTLLDFDL